MSKHRKRFVAPTNNFQSAHGFSKHKLRAWWHFRSLRNKISRAFRKMKPIGYEKLGALMAIQAIESMNYRSFASVIKAEVDKNDPSKNT